MLNATVESEVITIAPLPKETREKKGKPEPKYRNGYCDEDLQQHLIGFFLSSCSLRSYFKTSNCVVPWTTFRNKVNQSGVRDLKKMEPKPSLEYAKTTIKNYLQSTKSNKQGRTANAAQCNRFLTDNEELAIVQLVRLTV